MKVKERRTFGWYLENGMVYLLLILLIFYPAYVGISSQFPFQVNRTVGWLWDRSNLEIILPFLLLVFTIGFLIVKILKRKTHKNLSALLISLLLFTIIFDAFQIYASVFEMMIVAIILFFIIFFQAIIKRKKF